MKKCKFKNVHTYFLWLTLNIEYITIYNNLFVDFKNFILDKKE